MPVLLFLSSSIQVIFNTLTSNIINTLKAEFHLSDVYTLLRHLSIYIIIRLLINIYFTYDLHSKAHFNLINLLFKYPKSMDSTEFSSLLSIHVPTLKDPLNVVQSLNTILYTIYTVYAHDFMIVAKVTMLFLVPATIMFVVHYLLNRNYANLMRHRQQCIHYYTEYISNFYLHVQFTTLNAKIESAQSLALHSMFYQTLIGAVGWSLFQFSSIAMLSMLHLFFHTVVVDMLLFGLNLIQLTGIVHSWQDHLRKQIALNAVQNLFQEPPAIESGPPISNKIEINGVSCILNKTPILHNITATINKNTMIIGHTNSGKSTLLKCIAHLLPFTGTITKCKVVYVSQETNFLSTSILFNILSMGPFYKDIEDVPLEIRNKIEFLLKKFKLSIHLDDPCRSLSMGQLQRIHLIRYLLYASDEWLLLDEPTSHLDPNTRNEVLDYLLNSSLKIVMVSHDLHVKHPFDIIQLESGAIIPTNQKLTKPKEAEINPPTLSNNGNKSENKDLLPSLFVTLLTIYQYIPLWRTLYAIICNICSGLMIPLQGYFIGLLFTTNDIQTTSIQLCLCGALNAFVEFNMQLSGYLLESKLSLQLRKLLLNNRHHSTNLLLFYTEYVGIIQYNGCHGVMTMIRAISTITASSVVIIYILQYYTLYVIGMTSLLIPVINKINKHFTALDFQLINNYQFVQDLQTSVLQLQKQINIQYIIDMLSFYKKQHSKSIHKYNLLKSLSNGILDVLPMILLLIVVYSTSTLVLDGLMNKEDGSIVIGIIVMTAVQLASFIGNLGNLSIVKGLMSTIQKHIELPDIDNYEFRAVDYLELTGVGYLEILKNVKMRFNKGIHVIKGQSGIGKTTLLKIVGNLIPCSGKIITNYQNRILYIEDCYLKTSIYENISMGTVIDDKKLKKYFEILKLTHLWEKRNEDYYSLNPSGGEQQRIILMRGLLSSANILLLDEMTSALDGNTTEIVLGLLQKSDKIIIMVSHREVKGDYYYEIKDKQLIKLE